MEEENRKSSCLGGEGSVRREVLWQLWGRRDTDGVGRQKMK